VVTSVIKGCTDASAKNYDVNAQQDDGSCVSYIYGCTDSGADNYNANADKSSNTCSYSPHLVFSPVSTVIQGQGFYQVIDGAVITAQYGDININSSTPINFKVSVQGPNANLAPSIVRLFRNGTLIQEIPCEKLQCTITLPDISITNGSNFQFLLKAQLDNMVVSTDSLHPDTIYSSVLYGGVEKLNYVSQIKN